jgi:hypothetical protein
LNDEDDKNESFFGAGYWSDQQVPTPNTPWLTGFPWDISVVRRKDNRLCRAIGGSPSITPLLQKRHSGAGPADDLPTT